MTSIPQVPYNAVGIQQHDPSPQSAIVDVYTGVTDEQTLVGLRDRAVFDEKTEYWNPVADSGTGLLFPGAVAAKTQQETEIRMRPTTFKGRQQLDLVDGQPDAHFNRSIHPDAWSTAPKKAWFNADKSGELPFVGYPNPQLSYLDTSAIVTHNLQDIDAHTLDQILKDSTKQPDWYDTYMRSVGGLLQGGDLPQAKSASNDQVYSDGRGLNSNPNVIQEQLQSQYDNEFAVARQLRIGKLDDDSRFKSSAPAADYQAQIQSKMVAQASYFNKLEDHKDIVTGYSRPIIKMV